ncbi:MAG: glycosyltransferase family 9 protein, partial [bacterium]
MQVGFCSSTQPTLLIAIGQLSLMAQAALIKKCRYFIGSDTGLMHIADAADIPLIAFFGPTVPEFGFAPSGKNAVILSRNLKCRPCSLHGSHSCPKGTLECLTSITPEEAAKRVLEICHSERKRGICCRGAIYCAQKSGRDKSRPYGRKISPFGRNDKMIGRN